MTKLSHRQRRFLEWLSDPKNHHEMAGSSDWCALPSFDIEVGESLHDNKLVEIRGTGIRINDAGRKALADGQYDGRSATLELDEADELDIMIGDVITQNVAVLGITGSGKSNTAGLLMERLLANNIPIAVIDIAEEYWALKTAYPVLVIGATADGVNDIAMTPDQGGQIADFSIRNGVSVVINLRGFKSWADRYVLVNGFLEGLWDAALKLRRPYRVFIEEAHNVAPQGEKKPTKEVLQRIATEGRKEGLGLVLMSQRPVRLDVTMRSQCKIKFLHQVMEPNDLGAYVNSVPKLAMPAAETERTAFGLAPGQAIVVHGSSVTVAQIRQRETFHAGFTPGQSADERPVAVHMDSKKIEALRQSLESPVIDDVPAKANDETGGLRREIARLEKQVAQLEAERDDLKRRLDKATAKPPAKMSVAPTPKATVGMPSPAKVIVPVSPAPLNLDQKAATIQQRGKQIAITQQEKAFALVLKRLRASLDRAWKKNTMVLIAASQGEIHETQLKNTLHIKGWYMPGILVDLGLVKRNGHYSGKKYQWVAREKLAKDYPDLDANVLEHRILRL